MAAIFPLGCVVDEAVEWSTALFYLDLADEYVGSPMLSALYPTWATRIGDRTRAAALLEEGYAVFCCERFMNVHEYRPDRFPEQPVSGPFIANLAGLLLNCTYGFPGIRLSADHPSTWCGRPVCMPAGWDGIEIDTIHIRGRTATLQAEHGAPAARIDFHDG